MIDTIFYFANTMDEYRDLVERQQISARTIVFVEETLEIYKNGKLYPDISGVKKAINNASTKSWLDTVRAIGELNNELREAFNASITDTNASLAEARTRIDEVRAKLINNKGDALIDIDKANGLIELFAEYWNASNGTYTNFENIWNAQAGKAGLTGEFVDTVNEKVNEFQSIVDIVNGRKDEWVKSTDINGNIVTKVGQLMSAEGGILRNYVTTTLVNPDLFSTIYNEMNLAKGTYESINARLNNNEQIVAGWLSLVDGLSATAQLFSEFLEGDEYAFLSSLKTYANGDESYFDLTATKILGALNKDNENKVAAKIFGYVKNNVSNLELTADNIQIGENVTLTDELSTIKGKLLVDGDVTAKAVVVGTNPQILIDSTNGIKHTGGKFQINMDGSGFFGNENSKISWTPDGAITATGINIVGSSNVPEGWEDLVNTVTKLDGYSYLGNNGITFANNNDTVILSLADGLKHYKTADNTKSGYNLKNDGSGYIANGLIWWDANGRTNLGSGANGITWNEDGTIATIGANLVIGNPGGEGTTYAYLTDTGILFNNTSDKVELKSPTGTDGGLIHTYKEDGQATNNHGYALYNDGSGLIANNVIHWDNEGNLTIGYKSNDPEGHDNSLTWDKDGNLIIGANFIVQGTDYSLEFSDIDKALSDLDLYNKSRAYITDAGIIIDNQNTLNRVTLATTDVGLIHLEIESYIEDGKTKYRVKQNGRSAYGFYNDGHGHVANGNITWGIDGSGNIGGADGISWDTNGNVTLGSLVLGKGTAGTTYDDREVRGLIAGLQLWQDARAYLTDGGILFDNQDTNNRVMLSTGPGTTGGLIHDYLNNDGTATGTHGYALYNNGEGQVANGHIKWGIKKVLNDLGLYEDKAWLSIDASDLNIYNGKDGQDGEQGAPGLDGKDGESITKYIENITTKTITDSTNETIVTHIHDIVSINMNDYLKIEDLDDYGFLDDAALQANLWLKGQLDGLDYKISNAQLGGSVSRTEIEEWVDTEAATYLQNHNFLTGNDIIGLVSHDLLRTALQFYVLDGDWNLCVDQNGNYIRGKFNDDNTKFTAEDETVYDKQTSGENAGKYVNGETILTPVMYTVSEMSAEFNKLNAYFKVAVDLDNKEYAGLFKVDENGEYFVSSDYSDSEVKYYRITDGDNKGKYTNGIKVLTKKLGLASSAEMLSYVKDYVDNDEALSTIRTWSSNIIGGVAEAGFNLTALVKALGNTTGEVNIDGIVNEISSNITIEASKITTGNYGQNSASGTLAAKLYNIDLELEKKLTAESTVFTNVSQTINNLDNNYLKLDGSNNDNKFLTPNSDISNKVLDYLKTTPYWDSEANEGQGAFKELTNYVLNSVYTEAISGLITKINNAESSMVSTTTREAITRRNILLDKKINGTITDEELAELNVIELDIAKRDLLIAKKKENGELISYEQEELDQLIDAYGNKENPLEDLLYEYITTENRISSAIDHKVASIETYVTKESIFNEENGTLDTTKLKSGVKISADDIYLNGTTWALVINADSIVSKQLHSYSGQVSNPTSTSDGYHVDISNGVIEGYSYSNNTKTEIYKFNADGSGYIGNNFSWNTDGVVTLSGVNAASVQTSNNDFHVDVMDGYIKGYTTGNKNLPSYYFKNDGSGSLAYNNITWNSSGDLVINNDNVSIELLSNPYDYQELDNPYYTDRFRGVYSGIVINKNNGYPVINIGNTFKEEDMPYTKTNQILLSGSSIELTSRYNSESSQPMLNTMLSSDGSGYFMRGMISWGEFVDEDDNSYIGINANANINLGDTYNPSKIKISWKSDYNVAENNGSSDISFTFEDDSTMDSYTGTLNIGGQTLLFINGILVQQ